MPKIRTLSQNNKMFGLAPKCGLSHDDLRDMAAEVSGGRTEHTSALYISEADEIIHRLESALNLPAAPPRSVNRQRAKTNVVSIDTPRQDKFLRSLWFLYPHRTSEGLEKLCLNTIKIAAPKTTKEFQKMIEAVKSMNAREEIKLKSNQEAA